MNSTWKYLSQFDKKVQKLVDENNTSFGNRGQIRQEVGFSKEKYGAIKKGQWLEDALEKTIVHLLRKTEKSKRQWFNQFNVASGAGCEKRESVDF